MLTTFDDDEYIVKSLQAGACGYLLKDMPSHDLAQAVKLAHAGIYQLAPSVAGKLVGQLELGTHRAPPEPAAPSPELNLTNRELDVLRLIATGATNREIAQELSISEGTVKNHVSNILSRLALRDRIQAALFAHEHKLV
jgi:DNA-binding NarL/FixJ family response regulator